MARVGDKEFDVREAAREALVAWAPTMPPHLISVIVDELAAVGSRKARWEADDAFLIAEKIVSLLSVEQRGHALSIIGATANGDSYFGADALKKIAEVASGGDRELFDWGWPFIRRNLRNSTQASWGLGLAFVLTHHARIDPAVVQEAANEMVEGCGAMEPWKVERAAYAALTVSKLHDPALAPVLEAAATGLCSSRNQWHQHRGLDIAKELPVQDPRKSSSPLVSAISVVLKAAPPVARARACLLLTERSDLRDPGARDDPAVIAAEIARAAAEQLKSNDENERRDAVGIFRQLGAAIAPQAAAEVYGTIERLTDCPADAVRGGAFDALKVLAPSLPPDVKGRAALLVVDAACGSDVNGGRYAASALDPLAAAIPPSHRSRAVVALLDAPGRHMRWHGREMLFALWTLRDSAPPERGAEVQEFLGDWKPGDRPPPQAW